MAKDRIMEAVEEIRTLEKLEKVVKECVRQLDDAVEELREDVDYLLAEATKIDPLSDRVESLEEND